MLDKQEIEKFIDNELKKLSIVDEIHQIFSFDDIITIENNLEVNNNIDELYNDYYSLKKQLQLKINLFSDVLYRDCEAQYFPNDKIQTKSDLILVDLIFHYFQSLAKLLKFERYSKKTVIPAKCYYCENELAINDYECSTCLTPIEEMFVFVENNERKQHEKTEKSMLDEVKTETSYLTRIENVQHNFGECKKSEIETVDYELINDVSITETKTETESNEENELNNPTQQYNENMINYNLLSNNHDKWLCEKCQNLNSLDSQECATCHLIYKILSDECSNGKENKINKAKNQKCNNNKSQVKFNNATNKTKQNNNKLKELPVTWTCWDSNCKQGNTENENFCKECKLQKKVPNAMSDNVQCYLKDSIKTIWICQKCSKRNDPKDAKCVQKNCNSYRFYVKPESNVTDNSVIDKQCLDQGSTNNGQWPCAQCTFMNEKKNKQCKVCDNSKSNNRSNKGKKAKFDNPDIWQCWNPGCFQSNIAQHQYCQFCHLIKYENKVQGALVEIENGEKTENIWICWTCNSFNELGNTECKKQNCPVKRFKKAKK